MIEILRELISVETKDSKTLWSMVKNWKRSWNKKNANSVNNAK